MWLSLLAGVALAGTPHALLIGVSDYSYDPDWTDLGSTRDLELLGDALRQRGVSDVRTLTDSDADKAGVLGALSRLSSEVSAGDHVWVHWSGHGQQIADDDRGEESDGLDEALVVYGAPQRGEDYDGTRHLRDDELQAALTPLREAAGPSGSVIVVLDSCHSGTGTRGDLPVRGGAPPIGAPGRARERSTGTDFVDVADTVALAPLLTLSAARDDQLAREAWGPDGRTYGALSLALASALGGQSRLSTWAGLYAEARGEMFRTVPGQEPQLEGARDLTLFEGRFRQPAASYLVASVISATTVRIQAGSLFGITPGTRVSFHAPDTSDPTRSDPWAVGEVVEVGVTDAKVRLEGAPKESLARARVFVEAWGTGGSTLRVAVDVPRRVGRTWRSAIADLPLVEVVEERPDVRLERRSEMIRLVYPQDLEHPILSEAAATPPEDSALLRRVRDLAFGALLQDVDLAARDRRLTLEIVPVDDCVSGEPLGEAITTLEPGQRVSIRVHNEGAETSYVSVFYFKASGELRTLWPEAGNAPEKLPPGTTRPLLCQLVDDTSAIELLKAFATDRPVDFSPLIGQRAPTRGAADAALQQWIDQLAAGTRGLGDPGVLDRGFSTELPFETIVP